MRCRVHTCARTTTVVKTHEASGAALHRRASPMMSSVRSWAVATALGGSAPSRALAQTGDCKSEDLAMDKNIRPQPLNFPKLHGCGPRPEIF